MQERILKAPTKENLLAGMGLLDKMPQLNSKDFKERKTGREERWQVISLHCIYEIEKGKSESCHHNVRHKATVRRTSSEF